MPTILSIIVVAWAWMQYQAGKGGFRLGVDLVGGTILVYEVDDAKLPEGFKAEDLVGPLKRRIDPADLYNITIRPVAGTPPRVEIILPTGGLHQANIERQNWEKLLAEAREAFPAGGRTDAYADLPRSRGATGLKAEILLKNPKADPEEVGEWINRKAGSSGDRRSLSTEQIEEIKGLIERQGQLVFKIIANGEDDQPAIQAALAWFKDTKNKETLKLANERGDPPPPLEREGGGRSFTAKPNNETGSYTYQWIELAKQEMYSLGLNSAALAKSPDLEAEIKKARERGEAFVPASLPLGASRLGHRLTSGAIGTSVFYSREIPAGAWGTERRKIKDRDVLGKKYEYFVLVRDGIGGRDIKGDDLSGAREDISGGAKGGRAIAFNFNPEAGERFHELTTINRPSGGEGAMKRNLAIVFDDQIVSAPVLQQAIRTNGQITGDFTQNEINDMVRILRAGALPATLKKDPVSQNSMGSTLGEDTINKGTSSVLWAFVAVLAFMVFYYRFAGLVACVALLANLLLTVAFMVLVQAAFTLPGLAGLVLMLGMAVDANVLIYERLREERDRGASLPQAIRNGYDRALPTIIDTHLSSIFTAIVLYVVGNDQLKGFGISLTVGLIISLFTSLYMTRTMFEVWLAEGWLKNLNFFEGLVKLLHARYWDFMSIRHYWFAATALLTVLGAALFIYRLDSSPDSDPTKRKATVLNIDFTGGTSLTARLSEPRTLSYLREKLETGAHLPDQALEQVFPSNQTGSRDEKSGERTSTFFTIRTSERNLSTVEQFVMARLGDDLKRLRLADPVVLLEEKGKQKEVPLADPTAPEKPTEVRLRFVDSKGGEDWASRSLVQTLLNAKFDAAGVARTAYRLEGVKEKDDLYAEMVLRLNEPVKRDRLMMILKKGDPEKGMTSVQSDLASKPMPERLENFDAQLAATTQERALYAILASWAAILLYLWFRFGSWTFGAAAVACLVHDLFFTLGCIAACHYIHGTWFGNLLGVQDFKIDLAAIAALLTLVGYSVNDTIVVFDRIREVRGKNPALTFKMINDAVNETLTRTILASATVMVVVLVLYLFGGEGVKLFAFVMIVGVVVGTYSSIYIASPLLVLFGEGKVPAALADRAPAKART
ncbi:MAG: protein translocase subunit SecF [Gemmataceae bacterium]|nr:protein translocase subunit SecF [Gemmataceae bacterium]